MQALRQRFQLPLGAIVQPLANPQDVPIVAPPGSAGIVRCKRCRTYMNPYMQWGDGGRCCNSSLPASPYHSQASPKHWHSTD